METEECDAQRRNGKIVPELRAVRKQIAAAQKNLKALERRKQKLELALQLNQENGHGAHK
jgi:hypothetical protein